jgi:hypothetical protein
MQPPCLNLPAVPCRLDFGGGDGALTTSIALNVIPFVLKNLESSSPQVGQGRSRRLATATCQAEDSNRQESTHQAHSGRCEASRFHVILADASLDACPLLLQALANMLWAYSKMPVTSPDMFKVIEGLVGCITKQLTLRCDIHHRPFDAQVRRGPACSGAPAGAVAGASFAVRAGPLPHQPPATSCPLREGTTPLHLAVTERPSPRWSMQALSNSCWALAHLKSRGLTIKPDNPTLQHFVEALSLSAAGMLSQLQQRCDLNNPQVGAVPWYTADEQLRLGPDHPLVWVQQGCSPGGAAQGSADLTPLSDGCLLAAGVLQVPAGGGALLQLPGAGQHRLVAGHPAGQRLQRHWQRAPAVQPHPLRVHPPPARHSHADAPGQAPACKRRVRGLQRAGRHGVHG